MAGWDLLAGLAERQWGLLTTAQAAAAGVSRLQISRLSQAGRLSRVGHGVFLVAGTPPPRHLGLKAAWLRLDPAHTVEERLESDPTAVVVSHECASRLWEFGDLLGDIHEFTSPIRRRTRDTEVRIHTGHLTSHEIDVVDGLPVTTPLRTVQDLLAAGYDGSQIGSILVDAINRGLISESTLPQALQPWAGKYGCADGAQLAQLLIANSTPVLLAPRGAP